MKGILPDMGFIVPLLFYKDGFGFKQPMKVDMPLNKEARPIYHSKSYEIISTIQIYELTQGQFFKRSLTSLNSEFSFS